MGIEVSKVRRIKLKRELCFVNVNYVTTSFGATKIGTAQPYAHTHALYNSGQLDYSLDQNYGGRYLVVAFGCFYANTAGLRAIACGGLRLTKRGRRVGTALRGRWWDDSCLFRSRSAASQPLVSDRCAETKIERYSKVDNTWQRFSLFWSNECSVLLFLINVFAFWILLCTVSIS